ncbi:DUF5992 family protein [Aliikangiella maris]|uniref:DUF5992 family protein n=2 Tax=Aliikangiella maris TaxID=3162458 RepID=A0ABV2C092_9GAMM
MKLIKLLSFCVASFISSNVIAGTYVIVDATIEAVGNTSGNKANFYVRTTGGAGPCVGQQITFPEADASNPNAHQRAYSAALMALSSGMKVKIHNYFSDSCDRASFIEVIK